MTLERPNSQFLDGMLGVEHRLLDHGKLVVLDYMGNDQEVVNAARTSYGKGTRTLRDDRGLIRYLVRNRHTSPLEMCEIKFYVKLPIFVARQWIRHRTANVNEYSARYSILDREFYLPTPDVLAAQSTTNRQGRGEVLTPEESAHVLKLINDDCLHAYETYEYLLNDDGEGKPVRQDEPQLARELARMNLTLNYYTQWIWKTDLHNLLHFLSLRADSHAQHEIRVYADVICQLVAGWVPTTWEAFVDFRREACTFSRQEMEVLREMAEHFVAEIDRSGTDRREHFKQMFEVQGVETVRERGDFLKKLKVVLP